MNLTELKNTPVSELITLGENMGLENLARMRKQDIIFAILKQHAKSGEDIFGDGVLEILQDGFGSVSYTHLDVYKRQAWCWRGRVPVRRE